jgi:hypothetical protein
MRSKRLFHSCGQPAARLAQGTVSGRQAIVYSSETEPRRIHLSTRLIADPSRKEGGRKQLEFWTHDLTGGEICTNWGTLQPGAISYQASFKGGPGWQKNSISLDDLKSSPEGKKESEKDIEPLLLWNDVHSLDLLADVIQDGTPAVGLVRWQDAEMTFSEE